MADTKTTLPLFWLSKTDKAEVSFSEGDSGALMIVSVIDKGNKKRIEGMLRIPREKLVDLKEWLSQLLDNLE